VFVTELPEKPPRRLPWTLIAVVVGLAALGAIWLVRIVIGMLWTLVEVGVLVLAAYLIYVLLRARHRRAAARPQPREHT
jgi:hypothetical protein